MSNVRSPKRIASALAVSALLSLSLAGGAYADSATDIAPGALTPPPPVELNVNSMNLMANKYLSSYYSSISKASSSQVNVFGSTTAGQTVDSIGIQFVLQRWTGTTWVDAGGASDNGTNKASHSATKTFSVTQGYYYRAMTTHWINENGTYEEGTYFTSSLLVEK